MYRYAQAGPDALLTTFMEVYLPFGFHMDHAALRAMLQPARAAASLARAGGANGGAVQVESS